MNAERLEQFLAAFNAEFAAHRVGSPPERFIVEVVEEEKVIEVSRTSGFFDHHLHTRLLRCGAIFAATQGEFIEAHYRTLLDIIRGRRVMWFAFDYMDEDALDLEIAALLSSEQPISVFEDTPHEMVT